MMDAIILYKAYFSYLNEPDYKHTELLNPTKREAIIAHLRWELHNEKEKFMGVYGYVLRRISPRLTKMRRYVYVPELGGHIEICEDEDKYEELLSKQIKMLTEAEKIFASIQDTEQMILREIQLLDAKKNTEIDKKFRAKYYDKLMETERWCGHKNPKQLELF